MTKDATQTAINAKIAMIDHYATLSDEHLTKAIHLSNDFLMVNVFTPPHISEQHTRLLKIRELLIELTEQCETFVDK